MKIKPQLIIRVGDKFQSEKLVEGILPSIWVIIAIDKEFSIVKVEQNYNSTDGRSNAIRYMDIEYLREYITINNYKKIR